MLVVQTNEEFTPTSFPQFLYDSIALSAHVEVSVRGAAFSAMSTLCTILWHVI